MSIDVTKPHRSSAVRGLAHRVAVALMGTSAVLLPAAGAQAQNLATQGRELSILTPLRALQARRPYTAGLRPIVGEGVGSGQAIKRQQPGEDQSVAAPLQGLLEIDVRKHERTRRDASEDLSSPLPNLMSEFDPFQAKVTKPAGGRVSLAPDPPSLAGSSYGVAFGEDRLQTLWGGDLNKVNSLLGSFRLRSDQIRTDVPNSAEQR